MRLLHHTALASLFATFGRAMSAYCKVKQNIEQSPPNTKKSNHPTFP